MTLHARKSGRARGGTGWLYVDNRESPTPIEHRGNNGEIITVPAGALLEARTAVCAHCRTEVVLNPHRTRARHHCPRCNYFVCDKCAAAGVCTFIDDLVDLILARPGTPALVTTPGGSPPEEVIKMLAERRPH